MLEDYLNSPKGSALFFPGYWLDPIRFLASCVCLPLSLYYLLKMFHSLYVFESSILKLHLFIFNTTMWLFLFLTVLGYERTPFGLTVGILHNVQEFGMALTVHSIYNNLSYDYVLAVMSVLFILEISFIFNTSQEMHQLTYAITFGIISHYISCYTIYILNNNELVHLIFSSMLWHMAYDQIVLFTYMFIPSLYNGDTFLWIEIPLTFGSIYTINKLYNK